MADIKIVRDSILNIDINSIVLPVPARIAKKRSKNIHLYEVSSVLSRYKMTEERYKEFSKQDSEHAIGEIHVLRDSDLSSIDILNPETSTEEIVKTIENNSKLIVLFPIKTREDKEVKEHLYMSGFRSLAQLIASDDDTLEQFSRLGIPVFPGLLDSLEKINDVFSQVNIQIFVCLNAKPDDIIYVN